MEPAIGIRAAARSGGKNVSENRLDYVKRDMLWSAISNVFFTIFPFVIRTLFIWYLGSEYLGLNSLCTSIIYVLNAADLGVANAFVYRLYRPVAEHDIEKACALLNFYRKVYIVIGLFIFFAGLLLMPFLENFIKRDVPSEVNIYVVFFIYLVNASVSYIVCAYKALVLLANQRRDYIDSIACFVLSSMYCVQIFFIIQKNYYAYLLVMPLFTLLSNLIKGMVVKKKYACYVCRGGISKECAAGLLKDVLSVAVYKCRDLSRNAFDSMIISSFVGLVALSYYQNYYMVLLVPILIRNILVNAITPSMGNCVATESKQGILEVYKVFVFVYVYVSGWFAICYGCLIQDFIVLWLGEDFILSDVFVLLLVLYFYVLGFSDQSKMFREAAGLWGTGRAFAVAEMVSNMVLNIALAYWMGIEGIILATILTIVWINIPFEHYIVYHNFFGHNMKKIVLFYGKAFLECVAAWWITMLGCSFMTPEGLLGLIWKAVFCIVVPPVFFFLFNYKKEELQYILKRFHKEAKR